MVFNTLTVGAAVTPSVIETYFSHYLNRAPLKQKPTAHISYHEGLRLIRQFLDYSSRHPVEDLQGFTSQWVPAPHWVRINDAEVAPKFLERATKLIQDQLGRQGLKKIGGQTWWQWRRPEQPLRAEWIEMKKEYHERKRTGAKCERVILYVHGGAYYFGSVDEHRYQMQRHARKLRARVLSPRYRLAPQFPFPCGLFDCLATYYYLLEHFDPSQILFAGDSAGAGMVLSMLVILRDQEQPLPAGTILLSPWVDLTHSFPSVAGDGVGDYIPPHGFHHKPSMAWPPPPSNELKKGSGNYGQPTDAVELPATAALDMKHRNKKGVDGNSDEDISALPQPKKKEAITALPLPSFGHSLSIMLDGQSIELREQIQLYTTNELLAHPLVSPVMQPSLGGLPPMLLQVGGAELLKDEQIYLAHKAANPKEFPPNDTIMKEFDPQRKTIDKYPPTDVQLQVWEDLCHVAPTLSFTRPAKYMYRSVAQFGAWALSQAQQKGIDIQNDDAVSFISSNMGEDGDGDAKSIAESTRKEENNSIETEEQSTTRAKLTAMGAVGKAGDPIPAFKDHMIRQRVTRHGIIYPLAPPSEMASLALDPASIGVIKQGPVRKWLAARAANDQKFGNEKKKIQKKREKELASGYDEIPGENPPPTALVTRRRKGVAPEEKKKGKSWGLAMWSGWGSSHDEHTLQREQKNNEKSATEATRKPNGVDQAGNGDLAVPDLDGVKKKRRMSGASKLSVPWGREKDRPRSPYTAQVRDTGQAGEAQDSPVPSGAPSALTRRTSGESSVLVSRPLSMAADSPIPVDREEAREVEPPIPTTGAISPQSEKIPGSENTFLSPSSSRPHNGVQAYPFKLRDHRGNPSTNTLDSTAPAGTETPASGAHSELVGDSPMPVELSSAMESDERLEQDDTVPTASQTMKSAGQSTVSVASSTEPQQKATAEAPQQETVDDIVSPIDTNKDELKEEHITPIEGQKKPFKVRNTIFDPRTSMLGSIGADGMPNAHYEFPTKTTNEQRSPSPNNQVSENTPPPAATTTREPGKPTEAMKAAPFKLRHTVYDPSVTLAKNQSPTEPLPTQIPKQESLSGADERSASPISEAEPAISSASSTDNPPSYDSMPLTNVIMPEPLNPRPRVIKEKKDYDDDRPPTPPPKDDKPYIKGNSQRGRGMQKPATNAPVSKFSATAAPVIGDLGFERKDLGVGVVEGEKRPQLESFVTASEGLFRTKVREWV